MSRFSRVILSVLAVVLGSCGGGGGGDSNGASPGPGSQATVNGHVLKGLVSGAVVRLQTVSADGTRVDLAQTTSRQDGSFEFHATPPAGAVILLTASGGVFIDEATRSSRGLSSSLRAIDVWEGSPRRIVLTPFSEVGVRLVEQATTVDWSDAAVRAANAQVADWLGIAGYLDFRPVDLLASTIPQQTTDVDISMSLSVGAVSTFARRIDADPATSLASALDGLYRLAFIDPLDDRLGPAYIGGLLDFVDLTGLSADAKRAVKSLALTGSTTPLNDNTLQRLIPRGVASGSASAPMPDDAFQLLGYPGGKTVFNKRGALIGYTSSAGAPDWQVAYTASVAELFGDGEVGIGRWNGGAIVSTVRSGGAFVPSVAFLPYNAMHYAVAKAATSAPVCGLRRLSLVAATTPTLQSQSVGEQLMIAGLTPDSMLSVQYLGDVYVGVDIGLRLLDGSVVRFRSYGGLNSPWAGGIRADGIELGLNAVEPVGALQNQGLSIAALVAGEGARKVVVRLKLRKTSDPTEMTAVFVAPDISPETTGCTSIGGTGPGISPLPIDGEQFVFGSFDVMPLFLGAPIGATFGGDGQLTSLARGPTINAPAYELAGNDSASVGRVLASDIVGGRPVTRLMPYAVVRPGAAVPISGTVVYDLVYASGAIAARGGSGSQVPVGRVDTATLEIVYGQYPAGTPNPLYGTARLRLEGSIDGLPFALSADPANPASGPVEARALGATFDGSNFAGGVGAPNGEYAALWYRSSVNGVPLNGSLLFRRRP